MINTNIEDKEYLFIFEKNKEEKQYFQNKKKLSQAP
jgi:hypothetical protein